MIETVFTFVVNDERHRSTFKCEIVFVTFWMINGTKFVRTGSFFVPTVSTVSVSAVLIFERIFS